MEARTELAEDEFVFVDEVLAAELTTRVAKLENEKQALQKRNVELEQQMSDAKQDLLKVIDEKEILLQALKQKTQHFGNSTKDITNDNERQLNKLKEQYQTPTQNSAETSDENSILKIQIEDSKQNLMKVTEENELLKKQIHSLQASKSLVNKSLPQYSQIFFLSNKVTSAATKTYLEISPKP